MTRRGHGEGSIYKRKDGRWAASLTIDGRRRKTFYGKTRREVQEQLKVALREQQQGTLITTPQQTIAQYLTQWLENQQSAIRARSFERYEQLVRLHILPVLGRVSLQKLTPQHVQALYTRKIKEGLSQTTVGMIHTVLHKALGDALRWGLVARNMCDAVSPPRIDRHEIQPLSVEQARKLLAEAQGHSLEALFVLALSTGMRRGELLGLKWQDINIATGILQVRRILTRSHGNRYVEAEPKTEKSRRSIILPTVTVEALKQHQARQEEARKLAGESWQERGLVFCTSLGTPLNPSKVLERFKALLRRAGLPSIRFHDLRHSTATILLGMGVHPKLVQELLGHNQISMTMDIYSHALPTMQRDAMNKLDDALR